MANFFEAFHSMKITFFLKNSNISTFAQVEDSHTAYNVPMKSNDSNSEQIFLHIENVFCVAYNKYLPYNCLRFKPVKSVFSCRFMLEFDRKSHKFHMHVPSWSWITRLLLLQRMNWSQKKLFLKYLYCVCEQVYA